MRVDVKGLTVVEDFLPACGVLLCDTGKLMMLTAIILVLILDRLKLVVG